VRVDSRADYSHLRRECYDIELVPLPRSLRLSNNDEALNRRAHWHIKELKEDAAT
jgi:hypothetical protein